MKIQESDKWRIKIQKSNKYWRKIAKNSRLPWLNNEEWKNLTILPQRFEIVEIA